MGVHNTGYLERKVSATVWLVSYVACIDVSWEVCKDEDSCILQSCFSSNRAEKSEAEQVTLNYDLHAIKHVVYCRTVSALLTVNSLPYWLSTVCPTDCQQSALLTVSSLPYWLSAVCPTDCQQSALLTVNSLSLLMKHEFALPWLQNAPLDPVLNQMAPFCTLQVAHIVNYVSRTTMLTKIHISSILNIKKFILHPQA